MKGFAHSYCKKKVRENYFKIPVVTHNLLRIHFFFFYGKFKGWCLETNVGGKNPTDVNFASIGNQIQFIDMIKYFQQNLSALANSLTDKEKSNF